MNNINNTRVNELQEKLLQAMDILNAHALSDLSFDRTIICTIEEDTEKEDGKYTVSNDSRFFIAYSNDTRLRVGDVVYVTIPQGNFENQKIIIGKKTDETTQPFTFTTPFDTIFDMTDNICSGKVSDGQLVANALNKYGNENYEYITLYNENCNYCGYTRLGLKAEFKTWIKNAVRGDYGLVVILTVNEPSTASNQQINEQKHQYTFSNSDMYGNTYDFETNYEQQIVIPLDNIKGTITNIKINFYQNSNFFDKFNKPLPCSEAGFVKDNDNYIKDDDGDYTLGENDTILDPNIFVQNVYMCFGYDISIFTDDMVQIYTQQYNTYKHSNEVNNNGIQQNRKVIKIRWVHVENGTPIDMVALSERETIETPYEVRWYRYQVGATAADAYCGVYWTRIEGAKGFQYSFDPDVNKQQEKIKAIIIYNSNTPYRSNELIFENEEDLPPSEEARHIMNALNIVADDGSNGNYRVYGQNNSIKDTEYGKISRTLSVWFDANSNGELDVNEKLKEDQKDSIVWRFPVNNTMIQLQDTSYEEIVEDRGDGQQVSFYQVYTHNPWYKINSYYSPNNSNNTITCSYTLNGRVYTTEKEFTFGPAGTMGSEQTLIIDFSNDTNAVNKALEADDVVAIELQLYDNQNIEQEIPSNSVKWAWYYNSELATSNENIVFPFEIENQTNKYINFSKNDFNINHLYILQATLGNLTTYFPIPIQDGRCSYITGPTQVIYQSNGEPAYNREQYMLYQKDLSNSINYTWRILHHISGSTEEEKNKKLDFIGSINIVTGKLQPLSIYVKDAPIYGIQAIDEEGEPLWTQPILVLQNQWPNGVINAWDGKSLVLDEKENMIISAAIAAGKKNSNDNTFSGVMIGDWKGKDVEDSISQQTGIYGFHHGAMSYAFKEDGTAFLGKDGRGRIIFDGNEATIESASYKNTGCGIKMDLDEPYLIISNNYDDKKINYFDTEYYPFQIGEKFRVDWDGIITAAVLRSNDITNQPLYLDGTIGVREKNNSNWVLGGKLGYIEANYGTIYEEEDNGETSTDYKSGIGMYHQGEEGEIVSVIKTTASNAGLSCGNYYLSLQNTESPAKKNMAVLRSVNNDLGRIVLDDLHLGIGFGPLQSTGKNTAFISLENSNKQGGTPKYVIGIDAAELHVHVDAADQHGIYARFA